MNQSSSQPKGQSGIQDDAKRAVARAAVEHVVEHVVEHTQEANVIGVGTGSTANFFIEELARALSEGRTAIRGAVASSEDTARRLTEIDVDVLELNEVGDIGLYVDGADETTSSGALIKGGGGALTREKIVAAVAAKFVCIVDESKCVERLGTFPLPVEVVPMARNLVSRRLTALGGQPRWREGFVTDNGNEILDVHGLVIEYPTELETELNQITGVVTNGLFALRPADVVLVGSARGVRRLK